MGTSSSVAVTSRVTSPDGGRSLSAGATDKIASPNDRRSRPESAKQPHVGKILLFFVFAAGWENGKQRTCRTVAASTIGFVVDVTHPQATVSAQAPAFFFPPSVLRFLPRHSEARRAAPYRSVKSRKEREICRHAFVSYPHNQTS